MTQPNLAISVIDVPPDFDGMNDSRAEWAGIAVSAFADTTGVDTMEDAVSDLLANLRHFCDRNGLNFDQLATRALGHYEAETQPPQ